MVKINKFVMNKNNKITDFKITVLPFDADRDTFFAVMVYYENGKTENFYESEKVFDCADYIVELSRKLSNDYKTTDKDFSDFIKTYVYKYRNRNYLIDDVTNDNDDGFWSCVNTIAERSGLSVSYVLHGKHFSKLCDRYNLEV